MVRFRSVACLLALVIAGLNVRRPADHGKHSRNCSGPQQRVRAKRVGERPANRDWSDAHRNHRSEWRLYLVGTARRSLRTPGRGQGFPEIHSAGHHPERKRDCDDSGASLRGRRDAASAGDGRRAIDSGHGDQPGQDSVRARSARPAAQRPQLYPAWACFSPESCRSPRVYRQREDRCAPARPTRSMASGRSRTTFLIDGANNFNGVDGGFVLRPPVDAITEFKILTHNASAEFGQSLGSTTNIITRSGSNRFHGALWEFLRNDIFDATNYFAATTEPLKQNQFGGTFGGPIRKDKTFFFVYYEGFRNRQGETDSSTVPSDGGAHRRFFGDLHGRIQRWLLQQSKPPAVQHFFQHALSQQPAAAAFQSNFPGLVEVLSARQQWTQCLYLDPNRAPGLGPGWDKDRSLPDRV